MKNTITNLLSKYEKTNLHILNGDNYDSVPLETLTNLRNWHNLSSTEKIYGFYMSSFFVKGNFLQKDRTYFYSCCILEDRLSFAGIEETSGWSKNANANTELYYDEITDIKINNNINIQIENAKGNSYFIQNDTAFTHDENDNSGLVFFSEKENIYMNIHNLYFDKELNTDIFKDLINNYNNHQELSLQHKNEVNQKIKELNNSKNYNSLLQHIEENKFIIDDFEYNINKLNALIGLNKITEAKLIYNQLSDSLKNEDSKNEQTLNKRILINTAIAKIKVIENKPYDAAYDYFLAKEEYNQLPNKDYSFNHELETEIEKNYSNFVSTFNEINVLDRKLITITKTNELYQSNHLKLY